jgi:hypothetical protein
MHFAAIALLVVLSSAPKAQSTNTNGQAEQRGTQESPIVVKVLPALKSEEEATQENNDRKEKTANDRNLVNATYVLAGIGILQLFVFGYQALKLKQTVKSAGEQSEAMERHIGEAARSANAMENIAAKIETGNQAVMRAYLTVVIGGAVFQQRREWQNDLKFEAKPSLVNTGNTPARNIRIQTAADILPIPVPQDFEYPLPDEPMNSAGIIGAHQNQSLTGIVKDFVPDGEVAMIKEGDGKALCVWGVVTYEDMFGHGHTTKFGQWLLWLPNNTVYGYYIPGQNDAD